MTCLSHHNAMHGALYNLYQSKIMSGAFYSFFYFMIVDLNGLATGSIYFLQMQVKFWLKNVKGGWSIECVYHIFGHKCRCN